MEWGRGSFCIAVDRGGAWLILSRFCMAVLWHPRNWVLDAWTWDGWTVIVGPFMVTVTKE